MRRYFSKEKLERVMLDVLCVTRGYWLTKPLYSGVGTILAFHRVCPKIAKKRIKAVSRLEVTPQYLEEVIRFFIKNNYEIVSLDYLLEALHSRKINKKFVVFTFDDGYADIFTYAYPIFEKYRAPFTIYITTNFPDGKASMWWNLLEDLMLKQDCLFVEMDSAMVEFDCRSIEEKENTFRKITAANVCQIEKILRSYKIDIYEETKKLTLSWSQIEQLAADPLVTIGSHSVNHSVLNKLSESELEEEIMESKKKLESHINRNVDHFCYPFGTRKEVGIRECRAVKKCKFKTAVTARNGNVFLAHRDNMEYLPRTIISGERESRNVQYLNVWINGFIGCMRNKFRRVVTI